MPLNASERAELPGDYPYWGANGVVGTVGDYLFNEELVLLGEDGAPFGDRLRDVAFLVRGPVWVNNHIHVLRPAPRVDARFLTYALNSVDWPGYISGSTRDKLTQDDMSRALVHIPPPPQQRAIADFLDAETTRIDALITKKRRLMESVQERMWMGTVTSLEQSCTNTAPLRRFLTRICDGPFGSSLTSAHYSDGGARVVRLGNIGFAEFRANDEAFISMDYYRDLQRHRVLVSDLLIAGLGDSRHHAGRACVAPDLGPSIVKADCYCAGVDRARAIPEFLAIYLSSPVGCAQVAVATRGSTRSRINLDIAKEIAVPVLDLHRQQQLVERTQAKRQVAAKVQRAIDAQLGLLREHRQALITAAVTGELPIPGVAA